MGNEKESLRGPIVEFFEVLKKVVETLHAESKAVSEILQDPATSRTELEAALALVLITNISINASIKAAADNVMQIVESTGKGSSSTQKESEFDLA